MEAFARTPDRLSSLDFFFLTFFFCSMLTPFLPVCRDLGEAIRMQGQARQDGRCHDPVGVSRSRANSSCRDPVSHKGVGCVGGLRNMFSRSTCATASVGRALLGVYLFEEGRRDLGIRFVRSAASRVSTREMVKRNGTGSPVARRAEWEHGCEVLSLDLGSNHTHKATLRGRGLRRLTGTAH